MEKGNDFVLEEYKIVRNGNSINPMETDEGWTDKDNATFVDIPNMCEADQ